MQKLEQEMYMLRLKVLEMASLGQMATESAMRAFVARDVALAESVIEGDQIINNLECEIDERTLRLLALAQPWAKDLRFIMSMVRVCINLERVGDEAVNIARSAKALGEKSVTSSLSQCVMQSMEALNDKVGVMLRESIVALQDNNVELARKVCKDDAACDNIYMDVIHQTIDCVSCDVPMGEAITRYMLTAKSLERIGDLSTNVAESVIFIVEGVDVKHGYMQHKTKKS